VPAPTIGSTADPNANQGPAFSRSGKYPQGSVPFAERMIKAGLIYEVRDAQSLVAAGVGVCRVLIPA